MILLAIAIAIVLNVVFVNRKNCIKYRQDNYDGHVTVTVNVCLCTRVSVLSSVCRCPCVTIKRIKTQHYDAVHNNNNNHVFKCRLCEQKIWIKHN